MKLKSILLLLLIPTFLLAQTNPQWLRSATISPDGQQIVFTYKGDLYKVPSSGGDATQLTYHDAHDYAAVWSKDGSKIAFASDRYGNFDVFVMDALGGSAERLTFHSNNEMPFTFSADDKSVLFGGIRQDIAEHRQYPHRSQSELYSVPADGGRVDQLFTFPAEYIQVNKDGSQMLYHDKKGGENEWRKHHVSSIARDIWRYDVATDTHTMITTFGGEDRQPIFSADEKSMYYLSEESGSFNVFKMDLSNPTQKTQLTNYELHPIRFLSMGNGTLCFGFDGELYTMKEGAAPQKVSVNIRTQDKSNNDKFISIKGGVNEMAVSPNGKEIAFISRGEVFVTSVEESFTKRLTNTPQQERFVTWGPEGKSIVYSREQDGKWSIYQTEKTRVEEPFFYASTLLKETFVISNKTDNYLAQYSPDGKKMAFIEGRRTLKVMDLATKKEVTLMTPEDLFHMRDGDKYFRWSPDSKWLLVDWNKTLSNDEVLLLAADGSKRVNLNESGYSDFRPKWVNDGKQMLWFSNRNGLKSYATSGRTEADVYSMFFTQEVWDKFNLTKEEFALQEAIEEAEKEAKEKAKKEKEKLEKEAAAKAKNKKRANKRNKSMAANSEKEDDDKEEADKVADLTFDWDQMKDRTARLTIHSSRLGDAVLSKDGDKLYYLSRFEKGMNLWTTNLR
ncbi:MAG: DPP IV N-terminal domain-containing protein [Bacteroidota bacterium]